MRKTVGTPTRRRGLLAWCLIKTVLVVVALVFLTALDTDLSQVIYQAF